MKATFLILLVILFAISGTSQNRSSEEQEIILIKQVIQTSYVEGLQNEGDTVKINRGFHPGFELLIPHPDGTLEKYSLVQWKSRIKGDLASGKLPRKGDKLISVKFLDVDVTEDAAMAKFEFFVGTKLTFVDYQFLYKFPDGWKIVSKIYHRF